MPGRGAMSGAQSYAGITRARGRARRAPSASAAQFGGAGGEPGRRQRRAARHAGHARRGGPGPASVSYAGACMTNGSACEAAVRGAERGRARRARLCGGAGGGAARTPSGRSRTPATPSSGSTGRSSGSKPRRRAGRTPSCARRAARTEISIDVADRHPVAVRGEQPRGRRVRDRGRRRRRGGAPAATSSRRATTSSAPSGAATRAEEAAREAGNAAAGAFGGAAAASPVHGRVRRSRIPDRRHRRGVTGSSIGRSTRSTRSTRTTRRAACGGTTGPGW